MNIVELSEVYKTLDAANAPQKILDQVINAIDRELGGDNLVLKIKPPDDGYPDFNRETWFTVPWLLKDLGLYLTLTPAQVRGLSQSISHLAKEMFGSRPRSYRAESGLGIASYPPELHAQAIVFLEKRFGKKFLDAGWDAGTRGGGYTTIDSMHRGMTMDGTTTRTGYDVRQHATLHGVSMIDRERFGDELARVSSRNRGILVDFMTTSEGS